MSDYENIKKQIKELIDRYSKYIKEGITVESQKERLTKNTLIIPLFQALGWNIEDVNEVAEEERVSKGWVDYGFRLYGIPKFYLEVKSFDAEIDDFESIKQAIKYAHHKGCPWAVLTNFNTIMIFNAEWITENLQHNLFITIKYDKFLDKFDNLLLLSKEAFEKNLLDEKAEAVGKKTKRANIDKQLIDDFTGYRNILSKSINNLNSGINEDELDEAVQRILNRLVFIRNCEDRGIEEPKLKQSLHQWEDNKRKRLVNRLREIFRYYYDNYDSEIFEEHICDDLDINDNVLKEIIDGLYYLKDKLYEYDFSMIEADVLGNIYEQYLGHILKKSEKRAKLKPGLVHKKEQGIYYTPTYIVDYIVRNTLGELLKRRNYNKKDVEKIRVLDPACGSGSFLLKAFDILDEYYSKTDKNYNQSQLDYNNCSPNVYNRKINIIENNIFGVDLDERAVDIARLNVLLKILEKKQRLPLLKNNIKCGNSLIDDENIAGDKAFKWEEEFSEIMNEDGFDLIIGNPPYVSWSRINQIERKKFETGKYLDISYTCRSHHKDSQPNYYLFFILKASSLLSENGYLSFIIPQEWLYHEKAKDFRNYIIKNFNGINIIQFNPEFRIFISLNEIVGTNSLILILSKKGKKTMKHYYISDKIECIVKEKLNKGLYDKKIIKKHNELFNNIWNILEDKNIEIRNKINNLDNITYLSNKEYFEVGAGFQPKIDKIDLYELKEGEDIRLNKNEINLVFNVIYDANEIKRYFIYTPKKRCWIIANDVNSEELLKTNYPYIFKILSKRIISKRNLWWHFPHTRKFDLIKSCKIKIMSPRTAKVPSFAIDNKKSVFKGTNTMIVSKLLSPFYVLAILNSTLSNYWYRNFGFEYHGGKTKKYEPAKVKRFSIPIKVMSETEQKPIIELVNKMIHLQERLYSLGDKKTDERIYLENEIRKTDEKIDDYIYKIYNLTNYKNIIEESLK